MPLDADEVRLRHMLEAAKDAVRFASGSSRPDLDHNRMRVFAIAKAIEIVDEAAIKISDDTKATLPDVAWASIAGMRNRLIHAYYDIDLNILWDTVELDLPPLIAVLETHIAGRN